MVAAPLISLNLTGTAWATPAHDQAGNMTSLPRPSSLATGRGCVWDAWNRLVEVKDGGGVMATHEYDGLNRRTIEMPDYGATTYYMHKYWNSSWQMLETRQNTNDDPPESSSVVRRFVWSARYIDAPVLQYHYAAKHYLLGDGNFNVTTAITTSGEAREHYQYEPYGREKILNGGTPDSDGAEWTDDPNNSTDISNHTLYTGRWQDFRTLLYNYRHRTYSVELGRFLSRDPVEADINLYRYVHNNPVLYVDPSGLIDVTKHGPTYGAGSPDPTSKANTIATNYEFSNWRTSDLGGMIQRVSDEGTFSFSGNGVGGTWSWNETYDEGWVRGIVNKAYDFRDFHIASPKQPAEAVEKFFGRTFTRKANNTLYLGEWQICSWDFTMTATFDMRNAWRNDWVPLNPAKVTFGGAGNHTWQTSLAAYAVGGGGGIAWFESNENNGPLYGFAKFLFPNQGVAPPVGNWAFGTFHAISHDTWTESWKSGQAKPTMKYDGGYQ